MFAFDRRGFGRSEGLRGDIGPDVVGDQFEFVDTIVGHFNLEKEKKYLFGISMGGLLSARLIQARPDFFSGVIFVVPWFGNHETIAVSKPMRCLLGVMAKCCRNRRIPRKPRDAEWEELFAFRAQDPLYVTFTCYHMPHIGLNLQDMMNE